MDLNELIMGSAGDVPDYVVIASTGEFFLAVKPLLAFVKKANALGFGLRFRAVTAPESGVSDPSCHGIVWDKIEFSVLKPTHASASIMVGAVPMQLLKDKADPEKILDFFAEEGVFKNLAEFVSKYVGKPEDLKVSTEKEMIDGIRGAMGARLNFVDQKMQAGEEVQGDGDSEWSEVADWAENLTKPKSGKLN